MKRILFALGVALWLCAPAHAQVVSAYTVSACGAQSNPAGQPFPLTMDLKGNLCESPSNTSAAPLYVSPGVGATWAATESGTWQVTPTVPAASTMNLTSTTTAYTAGQLVANNASAGSITNPSITMPAAGGAMLRLRLWSDDATATAWANASVQIDLWDAAPTWTNGDHGTWLPATGAAHHIASFSCTFGATVWGDGLATECAPNVGNYASIVATTVYWSAEATSGSGVLGGSKHLYLKAELN